MKRISNYCEANNIKLILFIPPTHVDLQQKIKHYKLADMNRKFKSDLASIGDLYDFDYPNQYTRDPENFSDPFHFGIKIKNIVQEELFNEMPNVARFVKRN